MGCSGGRWIWRRVYSSRATVERNEPLRRAENPSTRLSGPEDLLLFRVKAVLDGVGGGLVEGEVARRDEVAKQLGGLREAYGGMAGAVGQDVIELVSD